MTHHLVIDIETLSTSADAMILEFAAILLRPDGTTSEVGEFVANPKGHTSTETINFHQEKTDLFHRYFRSIDSHRYFHYIITELNSLTAGLESDIIVWAWGSDFDFPILRTTCEVAEIKLLPSVPYQNFRCLRTFANSFLSKQELPKKPGNYHSAFVDCRWELEVLKLALAKHKALQEIAEQWNSRNSSTS